MTLVPNLGKGEICKYTVVMFFYYTQSGVIAARGIISVWL